MWIGWLEIDLLLGDVHSLKQKRSAVRPIISELRRKFDISVAETGHQELYRRAEIGVALAAPDAAMAQHLLDRVERFVAERPEIELLSTRRGLRSSDDQ